MLLAALPARAEEPGPWKMVMDKNGIKAYQRSIPGTNIHEIRAVTVVEAQLETVGEVLRDVPANEEWLPWCEVARVITMRDRNDMDVYVVLDLPWPVSNRDMVLCSKATYDIPHARAIVDLKTITHPRKPVVKGTVRITDFSGVYVIEYVSRNRTGLIYTYRVDLGGRIPVRILNFLGKYTLYDTFMGLKEMARKKKYIQAGLTSQDRELCEGILADADAVHRIFRNRLLEFVGDKEFIEKVAADQDILEAFFADEQGCMAEILLYGWGSVDSKKKAIRALLREHLKKQVDDPDKIESIVKDDAVVEAILKGTGSAGKLIASGL